MDFETLKNIGGFMRKASLLRCSINSGFLKDIKKDYNVDGTEAIKNFSLLPTETVFLFIWKLINRALIEEPLEHIAEASETEYVVGSFSRAISLEEAKILFKGIANEIGGDDGAYALCAIIILIWLS